VIIKNNIHDKIRQTALEIERSKIIDNTYYISCSMEARKVSNSKSDLQGNSRSLVMVPIDRTYTISY